MFAQHTWSNEPTLQNDFLGLDIWRGGRRALETSPWLMTKLAPDEDCEVTRVGSSGHQFGFSGMWWFEEWIGDGVEAAIYD